MSATHMALALSALDVLVELLLCFSVPCMLLLLGG